VRIEHDVALSRFTTIGTGGYARAFGAPHSLDELVELLRFADEQALPVAVVGLGSNVLVADDGFPGLVLKLGGALAQVAVGNVERGETWLEAGGGAPLAVCLHRARAAALGGLEFACAIPGTVGGAVWMNAGAYGSDVRAILDTAVVATAAGAAARTPEELGLEYRRSGLRPGEVVASARFGLVRRPEEEIRKIVGELQRQRKEAQPTNRRTFGSVFKNPAHELTAGRLLEACGLRGFRFGGAQISPKHANFIENAGDATTADVLELIAEARRRALERYGVVLEPEVQLIGSIEIPALDADARAQP
jgi:UDP-N-acetylenolpyruvoylglucosamine reductase